MLLPPSMPLCDGRCCNGPRSISRSGLPPFLSDRAPGSRDGDRAHWAIARPHCKQRWTRSLVSHPVASCRYYNALYRSIKITKLCLGEYSYDVKRSARSFWFETLFPLTFHLVDTIVAIVNSWYHVQDKMHLWGQSDN